jgi:hypothetical protein
MQNGADLGLSTTTGCRRLPERFLTILATLLGMAYRLQLMLLLGSSQSEPPCQLKPARSYSNLIAFNALAHILSSRTLFLLMV